MRKLSKSAVMLMILILMTVVAASACSSNKNTDNNASPSSDNSSNNSSSTNSSSGTNSTSDNSSSGTSNDQTSAKPEPRITLTMFMGNSGLTHPDNVDPSDNKYINIVKDYANVDLKLTVPSTDFDTQYNLLLASGQLPDIVHTWLLDETIKQADQGAFIDLKKYYDNSPIIQNIIPPDMFELSKTASGHYYRIPMRYDQTPQGGGMLARYDLLVKYNDGKWPATVEDWVDVARKIHAAEPNASVFPEVRYVYYDWYGADPGGYRIQNGKIIPTILLPEFREATILLKQLYNEGILDKEFSTLDWNALTTRWSKKSSLLRHTSMDQVVAAALIYAEGKNFDNSENSAATSFRLVFAPYLDQYPSVLSDPKYAQTKAGLPIIDHGLYISSNSKNPDRAWKVIEGFASPKLYDAVFWGDEDVNFKYEGDKRVPLTDTLGPGTDAGSKDYWSLHLMLINGFVANQDAKRVVAEKKLGKEYTDMLYNSAAVIDVQSKANGYSGLPGFEPSEQASTKLGEANVEVVKIYTEAIMGRISMEQFDQRVAAWEKTYRSAIYDEMQQYLDTNKQKLLDMGVKSAGW